MGTDIHICVEKYDDWDKRWELVTTPHGAFGDRNYRLFGVLANVRNNEGFAGCSLGEAVQPISEPRGLPEDAAPQTRTCLERSADHSYSYVTFAELAAYPWSRHIEQHGVIDVTAYHTWDRVSRPATYAGWVSGQNVMVVDQRRATEGGLPSGTTHVWVAWRETMQERCARFLAWIDALCTLTELQYAKPEHIRLVFGFDS